MRHRPLHVFFILGAAVLFALFAIEKHKEDVVQGAQRQSLRECLSRTASPIRSICWGGEIIDTLQQKGLAAAFDTFKSFYEKDPEFRGLNCHDAGHILGTAAYKEYADDHTIIDRPETSYCGYGFYHGFMEAMLLDQGSGQFQKVRAYCDALKTNGELNNASGACYHGIGHAAFDSLPAKVWGDDAKMASAALTVSDTAALGQPERVQCSTGVYNSLAIAYSAHSYHLSFRSTNPMSICRQQKSEYQKGCFAEVGIGVIREERLDRDETLAFINSFNNPAGETAALSGYAADEMKRSPNPQALPELQRFCVSLKTPVMQQTCMRGIIAGIAQGAAEPGKEYELVSQFCELYPGSAQQDCYLYAATQGLHTKENKQP